MDAVAELNDSTAIGGLNRGEVAVPRARFREAGNQSPGPVVDGHSDVVQFGAFHRKTVHFLSVCVSHVTMSRFQCVIAALFSQLSMPCRPPSTVITSHFTPAFRMASHISGDCG